jgi:hypothetical protein
LVIPNMTGARIRDRGSACKSRNRRNISPRATSNLPMARILVTFALGFCLLPAALAAAPEPRHVKPDRAAINRLLDEFIPAAVAQKDLQRGWELSAGAARTTTHAQWLAGDTSVQRYPAKGTRFHGWLVNYSYPGDIGFDILLQPTKPSVGAWSFRAEAQKIHGAWKITTWYAIATFAPPGKTQTVLGPNDIGPADGATAASTSHGRLGAWVLLLPIAAVGAIALGAGGFAGSRWARRRRRVREIERTLAAGG